MFWRKADNSKGGVVVGDEVSKPSRMTARLMAGNWWRDMPFTFLGSN